MIQSKLYIPTSTLNFNSIMSSESISPAEFYSVRGFGYKRFEKVAPNDLDNRIILYDKYPVFNVNDKELENYPLVIEVDISTINDDIIKRYKDGIYFSEETIYFNPFTTKFFFREEREKHSTLSKSEPSIEAKMVTVYQNCFFVKDIDIESFEWKTIEVVDVTSNFDIHISKDRKINKLKGFLYAYLLGANKSLSSEVVSLKKYAKELKNVLSAVISSSDGQATNKQELQLKELYQSINNAFYKAEGLDKKLDNIIKLKTEQHKCSSFVDILRSEGLFEIWCSKQNLRPSFQIKQFYISRNSSSDDRQRLFDDYFVELERNIDKFVSTRNNRVKELPIIQHCSKVESISTQKEFLTKLINEYLSEAYNHTEFLQSRYDFAFSGGKLFREELHEKWDGSEHQVYINSLLKNLKEYTPFVLNSTSNPTLKSFGAFCQKGDDDIDKLEDYLMSNAIGDFRIAFALWGIVFGFANMPKTLTNGLFLSDDLDYISDVYKYIFKQIHGIELDGKIERKQEKKSAITTPSKLNDNIPAEFKADEKKETITEQANGIEVEYRKKLKQIPKISATQIDSVIEVLKSNHFIVNKSLELISKIKGFRKTSKIFKAIKECLLPNQQKSIQQYAPTLGFDFPPEKEFYLDDNAWSYIEHLPFKNQKIKDKVKRNLKTIQDGYRPDGFYFKRGDSNENKEVIKHFLVWNISEKNNYNKLQEYDFSNEIREEIRKILESKYPN